jgi:hypothetical protein
MSVTTTIDGPAPGPEPKSLLGRIVGVLVSPRATYADIAARPRVLVALVVALVLFGGPSFLFMSTDVGKDALLDEQARMMESFGVDMPDEAWEQMESQVDRFPYFSLGGSTAMFILGATVVAGLVMAIFTALMGGEASFKQAFAIVVHSGFVLALQGLFSLPLMYAKGSMGGVSNLTVFLPFLDDTSFVSRFLGTIDLFVVWWLLNLAIGVAVLFKRKTEPIAIGFLITYIVIALIVAGVMTTLAGA